MARTQTMVQLTDDLIELLDGEAERRGVSRSALIREAVASYLAEARDKRLDAAIVDGYTRNPQGAPDDWGELARDGDAATDEVLHRLDDEESAGGSAW